MNSGNIIIFSPFSYKKTREACFPFPKRLLEFQIVSALGTKSSYGETESFVKGNFERIIGEETGICFRTYKNAWYFFGTLSCNYKQATNYDRFI